MYYSFMLQNDSGIRGHLPLKSSQLFSSVLLPAPRLSTFRPFIYCVRTLGSFPLLVHFVHGSSQKPKPGESLPDTVALSLVGGRTQRRRPTVRRLFRPLLRRTVRDAAEHTMVSMPHVVVNAHWRRQEHHQVITPSPSPVDPSTASPRFPMAPDTSRLVSSAIQRPTTCHNCSADGSDIRVQEGACSDIH